MSAKEGVTVALRDAETCIVERYAARHEMPDRRRKGSIDVLVTGARGDLVEAVEASTAVLRALRGAYPGESITVVFEPIGAPEIHVKQAPPGEEQAVREIVEGCVA